MSFELALSKHFPGAMEQSLFVKRSFAQLAPFGFSAFNTIACVGVCRDELCAALPTVVQDVWGEAFNLSSLAGMLFCGVSAFEAARAHSPMNLDKERYVYFSMTHVAIGAAGEAGSCARRGRTDTSIACGALGKVREQLLAGEFEREYDADDIELSMLRESLRHQFEDGREPDLIELAKATRVEALATLERMISLANDPAKSDHAVFSGVQIHTPDHRCLIWPGASYAVVDGARSELPFG